MAYPLAPLFENLLAPPLVFLLSHQLTYCQREAVVRTYLAPLGCSPLRPVVLKVDKNSYHFIFKVGGRERPKE